MRWKNSLVILGGVCLLLIAYVIPVSIVRAEDRSLGTKTKTYEIEEIRITSDNSSFLEELQDFSAILSSDIIIQESKNPEGDSETNRQSKEFIRKQVEEFICLIGNKEAVEISKFSTGTSLMASIHTGNAYVVWTCYVYDTEGNEYSFRVDDSTGKVLSFEIWQGTFWENEEEFMKGLARLGEYYGFDSFEIGDWDFWKEEGENVVIFHNEDEHGTELMMPIYKFGELFAFNFSAEDMETYYDMTEALNKSK